MVEADIALEKERREVDVDKVKEELAKVEKKVGEKVMEVYKASTDFMVKKAWAVVVFWTLEEFCNDHRKFNKEAFHKGFKLG